MKTVKWGILGAGRIARKFASDLKLVGDAEPIAVGSRTQQSADAFADEFGIKYRHAGYEELARNPEVDVIYIATPHSFHHEHTILCLQHGKAVLCEKPFAMDARQTTEMISLARQKNVFLMEALWTNFHPHFKKTQQMIADGMLGDIRSVLINFGFKPASPVPARLFDPALGGGTLLDIGIYNVFMATSILGIPESIEASMKPASTGVDEQCAILFKYGNGAMAQLFSSFCTNLATEADIAGTNGRIRLTSRFYEPSATIEYYPGYSDSRQIIPVEKEKGFGYQYEARHVNNCLKRGLTESGVRPLSDTLKLMELLDRIRKKAGIRYTTDE
ncbi:MAG TPA: Gfo/Idh/MocA family oxidoreductase [Mucilaginibacter sp.]|nr:Gfo/Idh/MocA family oxidoreductase [Mucilaginibacter sp.]